ncbi:ABC transporter permease [Streptomyces sp. NPDC088746]|uniref:ABC transporter permease n=1 Tax=Streptomyces sp. NPDC088746 TaxID=3365885 RepID=UPI0038158214
MTGTTLAPPVSPAPAARGRRRSGHLRGWAGRLGFYLVAAWSAVTLNFGLPRLMSGNATDAITQQIATKSGGSVPPETVASIQKLFGGTDQGLVREYLSYLGRILHGDLGISLTNYPTPVGELITSALPWTLLLVGTATVLSFLVGSALGALCGWRSGSRMDSVLSPLSTFLSSVPYFWVALFALWLFAFVLGWAPLAGGADPDAESGSPAFWLSTLHYGLLPVITMVFSSFGGWLLGMRNMTLTTTSEDYVLLGRAKGLSPARVMFRYAARNAVLPTFTSFALAIGSVIGGAVVTETVFGYPGMGNLLAGAVSNRDLPLMQGILLFTTLAVLVANFLVDSLYVLLDPRTRRQN